MFFLINLFPRAEEPLNIIGRLIPYYDGIEWKTNEELFDMGKMLMDVAVLWGKENGLYGVLLETQDVNLLACRFYLTYGFKLGGVDNKVNV